MIARRPRGGARTAVDTLRSVAAPHGPAMAARGREPECGAAVRRAARPRQAARSRPGLRGLPAAAVALLVALCSAGAASAPPRFDGAAALRHVERLVAIGPRAAGSAGGEKARHYIVAELKRAGVDVQLQGFDADTPHGRLRMANVIAKIPGRRADVIMLAGHYDTKFYREFRFVGANDAGSSTALLLELARVLAKTKPEFTYWLVFFDGEEARVQWTATDSLYGSRYLAAELARTKRLPRQWTATDSLYGSRYLAAELARTKRLPRALILADMIGDRDLAIRRESQSTPWLTDLVWDAARRLRYDAHFLPDTLTVEDDHVPFLRAGVPATLLIDFDYPPWHTAEDTLDKVSADSLRIVGEVVLAALPAVEERLRSGRTGSR